MKRILVTQSSMPDFNEYIDEIKDIWDTKWLTNVGSKHKELQNQLKEYLKVDNMELFTNGHTALEIALQALDLPKGGEVITTPFTFASTTQAIVRNGLIPVFCDIKMEDYTIDEKKIESLITDKTVAIVPVHVYGNICAVEEIDRIAKKFHLKVIYDAAHTFGVQYKGRGIGSFGDISMFSFHATKVFHTIEGGGLSFSDDALASKINAIRNFGIVDQETIEYIGTNGKMTEFCAAMGLCNLRHIDEEIRKRKRVVERYRKNLASVHGIRLNTVQQDVTSNYAYFPVIINEVDFRHSRDQVYDRLLENNINARKYFYPLTNSFDCYKSSFNFDQHQTPTALYVSENVLTLPLYADLSIEDVDRICEIIKEMGD